MQHGHKNYGVNCAQKVLDGRELTREGGSWQPCEPWATLCTDEEASYRKFAKENGNALVQIKGGKGTVKGIYHIQHLNAYHSNLKNFIGQFKGISSKYLNNYLVWNNEVERRKNGFAEKAVAVLQQVASAIFEETCSALFLRPAVPLLVKNQS